MVPVALWLAVAQTAPAAAAAEPAPASTDGTPPAKKQLWLDDKEAHGRHHKPAAPARQALVPISFFNVWTREVLPVVPDHPPPRDEIDRFLRCHFTNQSTRMNERLLPTLLRAARRFRSSRIEVVSGFRAPKYNLMLRKKGHEVARESEHPRGEAVDFRIPQIPTRTLLRFVRSLRQGGVGYYPESQFVHTDVGRVRYWRGH